MGAFESQLPFAGSYSSTVLVGVPLVPTSKEIHLAVYAHGTRHVERMAWRLLLHWSEPGLYFSTAG